MSAIRVAWSLLNHFSAANLDRVPNQLSVNVTNSDRCPLTKSKGRIRSLHKADDTLNWWETVKITACAKAKSVE